MATAAELEDEGVDQAEGAAAAAAGASQGPAKRVPKKKKEKKKKPVGSGSAGAFGGTAQQKETARVPLGPPPAKAAKAARAAPEPKAVKDPNRPGLGRKHCTVAEAYDEWDAS